MSDQQTPDERFVAERLQAAAGARAVSPNPEAVVHRGRRMRRRQRFAQGGLALGVVAGLALGAGHARGDADRKDVVVAVPAEIAWPKGSVYADRDAVCTYNEKTLAQRTLAFDGTIRTIESPTGGAAELDVHRWYAGGSGNYFNVDFPKLDNAGRKLEPGMRVLVSGMKDSGPDTPPVVWRCGFTRYWSQADAAVWDRAFGQSLGSPAAHSGAWCVSHPEANPYGGRWSDGADAVEAARQASEVLDERYGSNTATNRRHLRAGVLGVAGDQNSREMVVVVDPSQVSIADLQAQLNRGRDETKHPAPVVVRAGCRSAEDLERFGALLDRRDWHPDARKLDVEYYLSPSESSWIVDIERGPAADELKRLLGNYGTVLRKPIADF